MRAAEARVGLVLLRGRMERRDNGARHKSNHIFDNGHKQGTIHCTVVDLLLVIIARRDLCAAPAACSRQMRLQDKGQEDEMVQRLGHDGRRLKDCPEEWHAAYKEANTPNGKELERIQRHSCHRHGRA